MALSFKSLFSRKKKAAVDDGSEPFFTGSTLGPGLDDGPADDLDDFSSTGQPNGADSQPRGFADILDDEDWGDDLDDDDAMLGHGARKRKRLIMLAGVGALTALVGAGGVAWTLMDAGADAPPHATLAETPPVEPSAPIASGDKVSLPMPAAPGLDAGHTPSTETAEAGNAAPPGATLDPTAATDKSVARRPWLAGTDDANTAAEASQPPTDTEEPPQTAEAPTGDGGTDAPAASPETPPAEATPETPAAAPVETATAPPTPEIDEPRVPGSRADRPTPSYEELAAAPEAEPLRDAPVAALTRQTPAGPMPIPAPDGRKAWSTYAKPFEAPAGTPRIAIVVADLGLRPAATDAAIDKLPAGVTLAFSPYGFDLPVSMTKAREAGHEVMLSLPLEGRGFPANDPGPLGLNTLLPVNDNLIRLNTVMTKGVGYTGFLGRDGAAVTANQEIMAPVLETIGRAGLLYLQPDSGVQLARAGGPAAVAPPMAHVDLQLDERPFREAVEARLKALEDIARQRGSAVAVIDPTPLGYDAVASWLATLPGKGLALAPVSAVVRP